MSTLAALALASLVSGIHPPQLDDGPPPAAELRLAAPADRSVVRGDPAELPVRLAPDQAWAQGLRVEVDGQLRGYLLPWSTLELEPGLHRVSVRGYDVRDGAALRSAAVQVAVFEAASRAPAGRRERNGWTALVAFVLAVGGATALRRRGQL